MAVSRFSAGLQDDRSMGKLDAARDRGNAKECVGAMWRMRQVDEHDYAVATGTSCAVRDFIRIAFERAGPDWEQHARCDERFPRPTEVADLVCTSKAAVKYGLNPDTPAPNLARLTVHADRSALA